MAWLAQLVSLGSTTLPRGVLRYLLGVAGIVAGLNGLYLRRYERLMAALRERHPEVYAALRARPDVAGVAYSKGYRRVRPLQEFAPRLQELQDPALEEQFLAFLRFDRRFYVLAPLAVVALVLLGLLLGLGLTAA